MISIIIPTLNEATTIGRSLKRVLALQGDFEVIVVDGGSIDGTAGIARAVLVGRATVIESARGRGVQMNAGAAHASGDVLLFLHADTVLPTDALQAIGSALADPSVIGGRFRVRLDAPGWRFRLIGWSINLRDRLFRGFTGDQAIFVRTAVFRELEGFAVLPLMEDLDFSTRLCRRGRTIQLRQEALTSARRWQKNGVLRTILLMWRLRLLYVLRYPPERLARRYEDAR